MTKIRFIGDIHGRYLKLFPLLEDGINTVQVGDFGLGFGTLGAASYIDNMLSGVEGNHRYIRGNHDSPSECKLSKHWINDGTYEDGIMYIGGAASIDQEWRTEGVDWWPDEELPINELDAMIDAYNAYKPRIMVTHDCPESIAKRVMMPAVNSNIDFPSRTRQALEAMYHNHTPSLWIFGHWHKSVDYIDPYTYGRFICLNINEYADVDTETLEVTKYRLGYNGA